ncbi:M16 family metallopeptidase [Sphingosinithalassobacter sp. CS137]|uniref:M16 family metallopeptidase n=1 Tax=Sphingosinithalassobacter sp. CS137 TaxID=2762748 RepID=UPI0021D027E7|nr:insulinase family protein [Sphingosinithalassobacter sp. CS137]
MFMLARGFRIAAAALALAGAAVPALAQQTAPSVAPAAQPDTTPWIYRGSDIPRDPQWHFGTLDNGLRYAVRRNGVPPGQVSVRVRIDAGSLMERDSERGFAHLLEHLAFRGSEHVPDGESRRIWQRLGVTFGSDSNASTTFTQTVYQLDLPSADREGLSESLKILAGMMENPTITQDALDAERPVVLAEAREQPGPQVRLEDAMLRLVFAGQPLAERKPIGTTEALTAATPEAVQAFQRRWYRPERAVVVIAGDADPAVLEQLVVEHFADWQGTGPAPETPDFGTPGDGHPVSATLVEPALPTLVSLNVLRPWTVTFDTMRFNQERMVDLVAVRIINRRLESIARSGGSFLAAGANLDDVARSANVTTVQVLPVGDDWERAVREVRGVIADAVATPPTQAEIDREVAEIDAAMRNAIATEPVEPGSQIADTLVEAVDINEAVTNAEGSYTIFRGAVDGGMFTPEAVQTASARVFDGVAMRAILNTRVADDTATTRLAAAVEADVGGGERRDTVGAVDIGDLPALETPGEVVRRTVALDDPTIEQIAFDNGVELLLHQNDSEVNKVYVRVRFGGGINALPADRPAPGWAGEMALMASGIGDFGQEELDALTGDRQIELGFGVGEDAFILAGQTTREDLADQLRLFATKLAAPGWDPNPVERARAVLLAGYAGLSASPDGVLSRDLDSLLHAGDPRWGVPPIEEIEALTPERFRAFWEPLLAQGPIEVLVFGDLESETAIEAVAATFGALAPREAMTQPVPPVRFPEHVATPVVRTHEGQPDQAAAAIAWPTGSGSADIPESRKLEVLAAIFRDRLLEELRSQAGVSYSPNIVSQWPVGLPGGGSLVALGMVPPDKTGFFFTLARGIAADLVARPVEADELQRAIVPLIEGLRRRSTANPFWMALVEGGTRDPARLAAVRSIADDVVGTTPAELQALAAKYLQPSKDWTMVVVPEGSAAAEAAPANAAAVGR